MKLLSWFETRDELDDFEVEPVGLGLSKSQATWVNENWRLILAFWKVVDFQTVPKEAMAAAMKVGSPRYDLGNNLLKELLL